MKQHERGKEKMIITAPKLKRKVRKSMRGASLSFSLHDLFSGRKKDGCSGFIRNTANGSVVYVNTGMPVSAGKGHYLYRYADDEKDYSGYRNRFTSSADELAAGLAECLRYVRHPEEPRCQEENYGK